MVNTIGLADDDLVTLGAKASAAMVLKEYQLFRGHQIKQGEMVTILNHV